MKKLNLPEGMTLVYRPDIVRNHHRGWNSSDEFIEAAAITPPVDAKFSEGEEVYALFIDGDSIVARFAHLSLADQNRLNQVAAVIYRGGEHKPLYFTDRGEGVEEWNSLCLEMHHPEALYNDEDIMPPMPSIPPEHLN